MTASVNYDAYTVPSGLRALLIWGAYSTNSTSALIQVNLKTGGSYYMVSGTGTIHSTNANALQNMPFVFEPGDVISFFSDTTGPTILAAVQLFSTNFPIKTARLTPVVSGDNTLYTAPAGKIATRWGTPGVASMVGFIGPKIRQTTGSAVVYTVKLGGTTICSKGVASAATITTAETIVASLACVPSGQSLVINSPDSSSAQFAWVSVYEASQ